MASSGKDQISGQKIKDRSMMGIENMKLLIIIYNESIDVSGYARNNGLDEYYWKIIIPPNTADFVAAGMNIYRAF